MTLTDAVDEGDLFSPLTVIKDDLVAISSSPDLMVVLPFGVPRRRHRILTVPNPPQEIGMIGIIAIKDQDYFIPQLRDPEGASTLTRIGLSDAGPVTFFRVMKPGEANLDAADTFGIFVITDDPDHRTSYTIAIILPLLLP